MGGARDIKSNLVSKKGPGVRLSPTQIKGDWVPVGCPCQAALPVLVVRDKIAQLNMVNLAKLAKLTTCDRDRM